MPDRGLFWSPVPDWSRADIHHEELGIAAVPIETTWLVSGNLSGFLDRHGLSCVGPRETCERGTYALRLAPDRLLYVSHDGARSVGVIDREIFGWSDDGFAVTDVSDGLVLFDVVGPAAPDLMALGAAYDFAAKGAGSAESASMLFAGLRVAVAHILPGWRLHIERPYATALWQWLQYAASEWAKLPAREGQSAGSPLHAGKNRALP
jgi:heterotetrameric sarcosine oxidase gamma subunit